MIDALKLQKRSPEISRSENLKLTKQKRKFSTYSKIRHNFCIGAVVAEKRQHNLHQISSFLLKQTSYISCNTFEKNPGQWLAKGKLKTKTLL